MGSGEWDEDVGSQRKVRVHRKGTVVGDAAEHPADVHIESRHQE